MLRTYQLTRFLEKDFFPLGTQILLERQMNREKKKGRKASGGKGQREDRQEQERRKERRKLS